MVVSGLTIPPVFVQAGATPGPELVNTCPTVPKLREGPKASPFVMATLPSSKIPAQFVDAAMAEKYPPIASIPPLATRNPPYEDEPGLPNALKCPPIFSVLLPSAFAAIGRAGCLVRVSVRRQQASAVRHQAETTRGNN